LAEKYVKVNGKDLICAKVPKSW